MNILSIFGIPVFIFFIFPLVVAIGTFFFSKSYGPDQKVKPNYYLVVGFTALAVVIELLIGWVGNL